MGTKRRPGLNRRLAFTPDETFEWGLWLRDHDPARWAQISDRAKIACHYYALARAAWMATDDDDPDPDREEAA